MADLATFKIQFPEFAAANLNDPFLSAYLNAAIAEVDATACSTLSDQIIYFTAARQIALSPSGNTAKLSNDDGTTTYDKTLQRLSRKAVGGPVAV